MAGARQHEVACPSLYLAGKLQPGWPQHFLLDVIAAEEEVASMAWDEVVAQPLIHNPAGPLHCVAHGTAVFLYRAAAGVVRAHSAWPLMPH